MEQQKLKEWEELLLLGRWRRWASTGYRWKEVGCQQQPSQTSLVLYYQATGERGVSACSLKWKVMRTSPNVLEDYRLSFENVFFVNGFLVDSII